MSKIDTLDTVLSIVLTIDGIVALHTIVSFYGATSKLGIIGMISFACWVLCNAYVVVADTNVISKVKETVKKYLKYWKR